MFLRVTENTHGWIKKILFFYPTVNTIQFEGNKSYNYSIVNALGQVVSEGTTSNQNIAVSNLDNGMYTLRLNNENGSLTSKFFKK